MWRHISKAYDEGENVSDRASEERFDFDVLNKAIENAQYINIDQLGDIDKTFAEVESFDFPVAESIIVDIRHPDEQEPSL